MLADSDSDNLNRYVQMHNLAVAGEELAGLTNDLESRIVKKLRQLRFGRSHLDHFNLLLDVQTRVREEQVRRLAWMSPHLTAARSVAVNAKILSIKKKSICSPIAEQVHRAGFTPSRVDLSDYAEVARRARSKVDVVNIDRRRETITVVKGIGFSQAKKLSPKMGASHVVAPIFVSRPDVQCNINVPSEDIGALVLARDILQSMFPQLTVRALFVLLDDPDASWHFQAHDLTQVSQDWRSTDMIALDDFPPVITSLNFKERLAENDICFERLPNINNRHWLMGAPVDRSARSAMMLEAMIDKQQSTSELAAYTAADLRSTVEHAFSLFYPRDMLRHDLEDCLLRNGFVSQVIARNSTHYCVTSLGIVRYHLLRGAVAGWEDQDIEECVEAMRRQEKRLLNDTRFQA